MVPDGETRDSAGEDGSGDVGVSVFHSLLRREHYVSALQCRYHSTREDVGICIHFDSGGVVEAGDCVSAAGVPDRQDDCLCHPHIAGSTDNQIHLHGLLPQAF